MGKEDCIKFSPQNANERPSSVRAITSRVHLLWMGTLKGETHRATLGESPDG